MQLRNGVKMPRFGFGTAEIAPTLAEQVTIIRNAIDVGYRLLDTAFIYHTERGVGQAIRESGIDRDEFLFPRRSGMARRGGGKRQLLSPLRKASAGSAQTMWIC